METMCNRVSKAARSGPTPLRVVTGACRGSGRCGEPLTARRITGANLDGKLGYLLNYGGNLMKDGIERVVCGLPEADPRDE